MSLPANAEFYDVETGRTDIVATIVVNRQYWNTDTLALENYTVANLQDYLIAATETPTAGYRYVITIPTDVRTETTMEVSFYETPVDAADLALPLMRTVYTDVAARLGGEGEGDSLFDLVNNIAKKAK